MTEADDLRRALPPLDDGPGPARRLSDAETAALVGNVMAAWEGPPTPNEGPTPNGGVPSPAASKLLRFGLGGVALVAFGIGLGVVAMHQPEPAPSAVATIGPIELLDAAAPELSATSEPSETIEVDDEGDEPRRVRRRRPRVEPDPAPAMVAETADDLLRRANALRGAGDYRGAERTYLEVTSAHPSTHAAYVARVAAAALRLEHLGDPGGAVRLYRSAIAHGGALDAESRAGLARAYARLGRDADEAEAWRGLLARHPSSPFAGRARSRLAELEAAP